MQWRRWTDQLSTLKMCHTFRKLKGSDGEPTDSEWTIFRRASALDILHEIQSDLQGKHITPEKFSGRIIFMWMFNDIVLDGKGNEDSCALTSRKIKEYASNLSDAFLGPWEESKSVSRIFDQFLWLLGSSCFTNGGRFREYRNSII